MLLIVAELVLWGLGRKRSRLRLVSLFLKRFRNQAKLLEIGMLIFLESIMSW
jgi:hypothetical protein